MFESFYASLYTLETRTFEEVVWKLNVVCMGKSDIRLITVYDIVIYSQRILTVQIKQMPYKKVYEDYVTNKKKPDIHMREIYSGYLWYKQKETK